MVGQGVTRFWRRLNRGLFPGKARLEWWRGGEAEGFTSGGMGECEVGGVEFELTEAGAVPVEVVAYDGDAEAFGVGRVDAELVGASGNGVEGDAGVIVFDADLLPLGGADLAVDFVVDLVWAIVDIETEREGDRSFVLGEDPVEESEVVFFDGAILKLDREMAMGFGGEAEDHEAGSVHVETVCGRVGNTLRDELANAVNDRVDFFGAPSGDREESAFFFNDNDVGILMDDFHELRGSRMVMQEVTASMAALTQRQAGSPPQ